ncbi:alpha/beta hydrolase [Oscillatoria sp. FACHB-1406]|uniref:alpha/beta fold hydrolase n=1 Tax=Oscillatoria sp. FACHB-1406 TaxID=2692846 RepID=UPI001686B9AF|nr:alpha/beta hydrolase [Oscillatoria sp. FACHB-1406]MBD2580472.1 alpha/beta hydrolase [Oscillatoria sp. FACHB-1406]
MPVDLQLLLLAIITLYHAIATFFEDRQLPPGQRFDIGGYSLHLCIAGTGQPTIVLDHSLGGVEGYLLLDKLAPLCKVCIYDRAGYGWSDRSPYPRTSQQIAKELDALLTAAKIEPPYILIGDSFGSYNVRLYANLFPEKVAGIVLTDGLHEEEMLALPCALKLLKLFFISGFIMSIIGSSLGLVRIIKDLGIFEILKPELRKFKQTPLQDTKRSFCRSKHWITMTREMLSLEESARQVSLAKQLSDIPIASLKAASFFIPSFWTKALPLKTANRARDRMHLKFSKLSPNLIQIEADKSSHFVWIDRPDAIVTAVKKVLDRIKD